MIHLFLDFLTSLTSNFSRASSMHRLANISGRVLYRHSRLAQTSSNFCQSSSDTKNGDTQPAIELDKQTLTKLERLSGLQFKNQKEIDDLKEEIRLADHIFEVDTTGIKPLYSIVEELIDCPLREDEPVVPDQTKVFANASQHVEGFFVSPPANVIVDESETIRNMK